jgi:NAD(P)-dependent dehydrogenase (short-subunit alcohol dehydrogenase family)
VGIVVRRPGDVAKVTAAHAGRPVLAVHAQPDDGEAAAGLVKGVEDSLGPVTALICCNGAFEGGPITEERGPRLARMLEANLTQTYTLARAIAPGFVKRAEGRMVFVGARAAVRGSSGMAAYLAAKGALHALALALAEELAPAGIAVNLVAPSVLDTPRNRKDMPDTRGDVFVALDDAASVVLFLGTPLARCLRGNALVVAGRS